LLIKILDFFPNIKRFFGVSIAQFHSISYISGYTKLEKKKS